MSEKIKNVEVLARQTAFKQASGISSHLEFLLDTSKFSEVGSYFASNMVIETFVNLSEIWNQINNKSIEVTLLSCTSPNNSYKPYKSEKFPYKVKLNF